MGYVNIVFFGWVFGLNKDEGCRGMANNKIVGVESLIFHFVFLGISFCCRQLLGISFCRLSLVGSFHFVFLWSVFYLMVFVLVNAREVLTDSRSSEY